MMPVEEIIDASWFIVVVVFVLCNLYCPFS